MSLEQALFQIAEALAANTAALQESTKATVARIEVFKASQLATQIALSTHDAALDAADATLAVDPEARTITVETPAAKKPAPAPAAKAEAPVEAETVLASPSNTTPSLAELTTATTQAATRNREALVELIASFGVKRAGSIPEAQWADYIAKAEAL